MPRRALALSSLWYLLLGALIFYPLHRRGYLLLLDWTPTPSVRWRTEEILGIHGLPALAVLKSISLVVPTWIIQRLILFGAVFGAGLSAHVAAPVRSQPPRFFAGTLYAINPFVFVRILAGHWKLLIFYALAPLAARAILRMAKEPSARSGAAAGAWIAGLAAVSVHALMLLVLLVAAGFWMLILRSGARRVGVALGTASLVVAIGISWWVVPAVLEGVPLQSGPDEIRGFASTATDGTPVPLAVAGLRGFWIERFNPSGPPAWPLVALALAGLMAFGASVALRDRRRLAAATLLSSSAFALVVAIGIANPLTAPFARALYRWIPGFLAFREPHKLAALMALTYAWLGAVAADWMYARRSLLIRGLALGLSIVPFVYTPAIFGGLGGRLHPTEYPATWTAAERFLVNDRDDYSVLFLPWKLYLPLPFNDPREPVANPAPQFFSVRIVSSQDPEVPGVRVPSDPVARKIEQLVLNSSDVTDMGARLAPLGFKYVMLLPNANPGGYDFLYGQIDLQVAFDSDDLVIFRNTAWTP